MRVSIVCFGAMREYLPASARDNRADVDIPADGTVADLMDELSAPHVLAHAVLVDGTRAELSSRLREGAEVTLMPPFAGGRSIGDPYGR